MIDGASLEEYKARVGLPAENRVLDAALRYHEARVKAHHGPVEEAIGLHRRLLDLLPDEPWVYQDLVRLYMLRGATSDAVALLLALGDVYLRLGRTDDVLRAYQQAAALAPHDPEIQARLAAPPKPPVPPPVETKPPAASAPPERPAAEAAVLEAPAPPPPPTAPTAAPAAPTPPPAAPADGRRPTEAGVKPSEPKPEAKPKRGAKLPGRKTETLGAILQQSGAVSLEQITQALEIQSRTGERLGQVLLDMKIITEVQLAQAMGKQWNYRYIDLNDTRIDPDAVKLIPHSLALRLRVMPITWERGRLVLAMTDPLNVIAVDDVRLMTGQEVEPVITTEDTLIAAISKHYQVEAPGDAVARDTFESTDLTEDDVSLELLKTLVEDAPVVRLLNTIIEEGIRESASDIHIEPQRSGLLVRYRIDGVLHDTMKPPRDVRAALISRAKIMADLDIAERRRPQDGRIHYKANARTVDLRVSSLPTIFGEKIVMRILDQATPLIGLNRLGFHSDTLRQWEQAISTPYGMILVTGPTGSGKTTTLYATLGTINTLEKNIVTVEDPVEYQLGRINQVQVNVKAGLTFATALRSILRQDPDIVMIGEMRDRETAEIGVQAALTGHMVLSTLHTNDAASAITRLVDMGVEPFLVSSSVVAILAQRLARQICPHCKIAYTPPPDALKRLGLDPEREISLYRGQGCEECRFTGYKGRIGVFELLIMSDGIRELVVRRAPSTEIKSVGVREGMQTLRDDGLEKVLSGVSTIDEILRVVYVAD